MNVNSPDEVQLIREWSLANGDRVELLLNRSQDKVQAYLFCQNNEIHLIETQGEDPAFFGVPRKIKGVLLTADRFSEIQQYFQSVYPVAVHSPRTNTYSLHFWEDNTQCQHDKLQEAKVENNQEDDYYTVVDEEDWPANPETPASSDETSQQLLSSQTCCRCTIL